MRIPLIDRFCSQLQLIKLLLIIDYSRATVGPNNSTADDKRLRANSRSPESQLNFLSGRRPSNARIFGVQGSPRIFKRQDISERNLRAIGLRRAHYLERPLRKWTSTMSVTLSNGMFVLWFKSELTYQMTQRLKF